MRPRLTSRRRAAAMRASHPRRGMSMIEILVAMTLLSVVLGALSVLTTRTVKRSRDLDVGSARTFVLMQQTNRFSALAYDSIPLYAPRVDTIIAGRFRYRRTLTYVQSTTASEYRTLKVMLFPVGSSPTDSSLTAKQKLPDSLVFQRAKTYTRTPLFQ
jgi:prepilin-type N-terminal cleavage/methylation domain-containing protein